MKRLLKYLLVLLLPSSFVSQAAVLPGPLVEPAWLADNADKVVVLDIRKDVKSFTAQARLAKDKKTGKLSLLSVGGHIPGARLIDYKKVRADRVIDGRKVEKILPEAGAFQSLLQAAGVNRDSVVVVVSKGMDAGDMTMAARLYWQIRYFGHDSVALLNGGMAQWILEGRPVTRDAPRIAKGDWQAGPGRADFLADSEQVAAAVKAGDTQLVDNRPFDQYLGVSKRSYVYDKGHIPGAKPLPADVVVTGRPARFLALDDLRKLHQGLGIDPARPTITYCNSGHLAAGGWFVQHELLGNSQARLYDGSMHEWTLDKRPVKALVLE